MGFGLIILGFWGEILGFGANLVDLVIKSWDLG